MISSDQLRSLAGKTTVGEDGHKIGKVVDVYESTAGPDATFITVSTGLFGSHASFVPLVHADLRGDELVVPYDKELVKHAPRVDSDEELTSTEEERLYRHYELLDQDQPAPAPAAAPAPAPGTVGHDTSGPTTDDAMTRSEEHLQVGTQQAETGRARLRKRVVTDTETVQVPVTEERAVVSREPITEADLGKATDGPAISEEEHEVVLTKEQPVVAKEAVPVERVRMGTETVTEDVQVSEQVRKEHVELDGDTDRR